MRLIVFECIQILFSAWYLVVYAKECEPLQENQPYHLLFPWKPSHQEVSTVALDRDGILLATCSAGMTCDNYFDHITGTEVSASHEGTLLIKYTIFRATRRNVGVWTLKQAQGPQHHKSIVSSCLLRSYTKIDTITCEKHLAPGGVDVVCQVHKVYPQAVCQFDVRLNKAEFRGQRQLVYTHEATLDDEQNVYHNTLCKLHIPKHALHSGTYSVGVTAYPNVTGNLRDAHYGTHTSVLFDVDESLSLVLKECNEVLTSDTDKVCVQKSGQEPEPENKQRNKTLETVFANHVESKSNINGKCEVATLENDIDVVCTFVHIFPNGVQCKLYLRHNHEDYLIIDGTTKTSELTSNQMSTYLSQCAIVVSGNFISPGRYEANVVARTVDETTMSSQNLTIYFELDVQNRTTKEDSSDLFHAHTGAIYLIISLLIVFVCLIAISYLAIRYKILTCCQNSVAEEEHPYEEIDVIEIQPGDVESQRLYETKIQNEDNLSGILDYIIAEECQLQNK